MTLEDDPLFAKDYTSKSLQEDRRITFLRVKRLVEYDFVNQWRKQQLSENEFISPAYNNVLMEFDTSVSLKLSLNQEVWS